MNIAGVGLEQDVAMENVDMKTGPETGAAGMAGFAASPHLLYFVILSVFRAVCGSIFGWLQAVGRYVRHPQGRRAARTPVLLLPTLCLALAFVCFSAIGALAQEGPDGTFDAPKNHDGTPFTMTIDFNGDVSGFEISDITFAQPTDCMTCIPDGGNFDMDYAPTVSLLMKDLTDSTRWTFTVTPSTHNGVSPDFSVTIPVKSVKDELNVFNVVAINLDSDFEPVIIRYMAPPPIQAPMANAGDDQSVVSEGKVTLDGRGSTVDSRRTPLTYAWTRTSGTGGSLTGENTATPTFTAPMLTADADDVIHTFTLTVTDSANESDTDPVEITVTPPIQAPMANAGDDQSVVSEGKVTLDGRGSTVDSRRTPLTYAWTRTSGTGGSLTGENTATPTFTAPMLTADADDVIHTFTLTVTDSANESDTDPVEITVTPPIQAPMANAGDDQSVVSEGKVTLDGRGSTVDSRRTPLTYAWTRTSGTGGSLTGENTATPTFTAPMLTADADDVIHTFTLTVTDSANESDTDPVEITVTPPIQAPMANAGDDQSVVSEGKVTLDGRGSTVDSRRTPLTYAWTRTSGTGGSLTGENTATPTFTAPMLTADADDVIHTFTLTVTDSANESDTDPVEITVTPPIQAPMANAGDDQSVVSEGKVTLDGRGSTVDSRRTPLTYAWTRTSGTGGSLTGENTATPTFTAPMLTADADDVIHTFTLTVTDSANESDTDPVEITVTPPIQAPMANAGDDQSVVSEGKVTLDGRGSTVDSRRTPLTYAWTRTSGTGGSLTGENTATPTFTAPMLTADADDVIHTFTLTVTDSANESDTDPVEITVTPPIQAPMANAGDDQSVVSEGKVTLDGRGSTVDSRRTPLTYAWTRTSGTGGSLTGENTATPTFTAPMLTADADDVIHTFTLTVTDSANESDTDPVEITVTPPIQAPMANAGDDQSVVSEGKVTLDGRSSTVDSRRTPLTYAWTRTSGTGGSLTGENTATPTFTAPMLTADADDVIHTFTLTVTDSANESDTDPVEITVTPPIQAPMANAGDDQSVVSEGKVTLDGRGSTVDSRRTPLTYAWTRTSGTGGSLTGENTATPTFTAPMLTADADDVIHTFTLTVTDSANESDTDPVEITVTAPNQAPIANAGDDQPVVSGVMVTLDGSGSTDPDDDGRIVSYLWTRMGGTADALPPGGLMGAGTATPSFTAQTLDPGDLDVTYVFELVVTDNEDAMSTPATVTVTVTAATVDIVVSPPEVSVQEGGSGTYRVRLSESPGREVTIMAISGNEAVVRLKNTRLVFNAGNWNDWQEVEIDAVADSVKKGDRIEVTIQHSLNGVASNKLVTVSVRAQEDDPILDHVGQFIATRATTLLGQQPDLIHFLKQDGLTQDSGGSFTFQATDGRLSLDGGFIHDGTWGEVTGARTDSESTDTKSVLGSFGIHRKYSETFLTGLMLQFDRADHELPQQTGTIDGTGWLVGPYFVARHGSQPLYFEGRLLYGYSDNDIRFMDRHLGARTGSFDSTRVLAQIRVEGEIAVPGWDHGDDGGAEVPQLIPYADLRWLEDRAAAFTTVSATTGFRVPVPGQTVNISQLELGSNMVVPVAVPTGSMILTGGLGLVFSNTEGNHIKSDARGRGRGEIGFSYGLDENVQIDFESFYDGIGSSGYEGYGLSLNAEMRF